MGKKKRTTTDEEIDDTVDTADSASDAELVDDLDDEIDLEDELEGEAGTGGDDAGDDEDEIFEERSAIARQFEREEDEDITEERTYTVPLGKAYMRPPNKRAKRAIAIIREFFARHMKPEELVILPEVNEYVFERGIQKPPRKVKIRATKSLEGTVTLYLNF
ncbi:MAG: 50S ribosomal protein L31e [Promethearchaeota archaeon]